MLENYRIVFDKMNEFVSWNRNRFCSKIVNQWRLRDFRKYFSVTAPEISLYGPYISICCFFTYDTGFPHETHEFKSFCYNTKTKSFANLSDVSGWTCEELHEIILNADFDDGFNMSKDLQNLDFQTIENLDFEVMENGKIKILFNDYILDRYMHEYVIERKK